MDDAHDSKLEPASPAQSGGRNPGSAQGEKFEPSVQSLLLARVSQRLHTGPLPDPETFARYEKVLPGAAKRIMTMAEAQMRHRHAIEDRRAASRSRNETTGLWLAFMLATIALGVAVFAIDRGLGLVGIASVLASLSTLVVPFLVRRRGAGDKTPSPEEGAKPQDELSPSRAEPS